MPTYHTFFQLRYVKIHILVHKISKTNFMVKIYRRNITDGIRVDKNTANTRC